MKYEKYKDSGVEWIGKIPEHWEVTRLKNLIEVHYSGVWGNESDESINDRNCIRIADFDFDNLTINEKNLTKRNYSDKEIEKYELRKGDILVEKSGGGDKTPVGRVVFFGLEESSLYANFIEMLRVKSVSKKFIAYLLSSMYHSGLIYTMFNQTTGIQNLNIPKYITQNIVLPKDNFEQEKIAIYLDKKTEKIDSIIKSLEDQKENLEQYKRELIAEVITKGLNSNIPMKDSGVDWIGQVPEHWEIHPLFSIFKQNKVKNIGMKNDNLLSLSYGNIIRKDIDTTFGLLPANFENYQIVDKGYIILRLTDLQNDKKSLRTALVNEKGIITSAYIGLVKINSKCNTDYMHYLLHSYDLRKVFYSMGSGLRQSLNFDDIKRLPIVLPKDDEQKEIVEYLDYRVNKVESIKNKLQLQIEKLKEYRKILIHEAVTGKIKIDGGSN